MPSDENDGGGVPAASTASSISAATSSGSEDGGHHGDERIERDISTTYGRTQSRQQQPEADEYGHTDSEQSEDDDDSGDEYTSGEYTDGSYDSDEYYTESEDEDDQQGQQAKKGSGGWWPFSRSGGSAAPQPPAKDEAEAGGLVEGSADEEPAAANDEEGDDQPETPDIEEEEEEEDEKVVGLSSPADKALEAEPSPDEQAVEQSETNDESKAAVSEDALPPEEGAESTEEDGESYASEDGSEETGTSDEYASDSADESSDSDDDDEGEDGQPSLSERRSLLSLAAEHDRVDIINTLLSGSDTSGGAGNQQQQQQQQQQIDPALVDLLLNNSPKHEDIFIPPLHVAIASGSTRAVAALLRLGSDPSIRPEVPREYTPPWVEGGGDAVRTSNARSSWRKFDGMSAWELAYGREAMEDDGDAEEDEPAVPARRSYFFGRFGSSAAEEKESAADDNENKAGGAKKIRKRSPLNIAPSKLEGIRHAFTAEALRAIGSDEVNRLTQLVNAGMDKGVEAGGKNLLGWAQEMEAVECVIMLTERWGADDEADVKEISTEKAENAPSAIAVDNPAGSTSPPDSTAPSSRVPPPPAPQSIGALRRALEQNESLTPALSAMLDNLAEECSISQGLLLSEAGSKSSLVNNVRSLKANKAEREDELVYWSGKLEDREWELDDRLRRIAMLGGAGERARIWKAVEERVHIKEIEERKKSQQNLTIDDEAPDSEDDVHLKAALQAELAASNTKLSQLRASIADLAEENDRNLAEVQRRGLAGAVKLARNLRQALRTVEDDLREVRSAEAGLRARVGLVTAELEKLEAAKESESRAKAKAAAEAHKKKQADASEQPVESGSGTNSPTPHESIANEDDVLMSDDEEFQKYVARQNAVEEVAVADAVDDQESDESDEDGVLVEHPSAPSPSRGGDKLELPSESIKAGHSTALVVRPKDSNGFLSTGLWQILKRIVGFGRVAAQESVDEVVDGYRQSIADVMIV